MIEMKAEIMAKLKSITGRFERNSEGQFVGRLYIDDEAIECWLVFDERRFTFTADPTYLKLTFDPPSRLSFSGL